MTNKTTEALKLVALRNAIKQWAFDCAWDDLSERQIDDLELLVIGVLNAAPVDAKAIRAEALEEAAKVCDARADGALQAAEFAGRNAVIAAEEATKCATAIRKLK